MNISFSGKITLQPRTRGSRPHTQQKTSSPPAKKDQSIQFAQMNAERLTLVFENAFRTPSSAVPRKLSPSQRPLCIVGRLLCCGEAGEKEKESARGTMGRGKREERPLPYNVRFSGQICGSLTMAEAGEDLADFECSFKDLSLEGQQTQFDADWSLIQIFFRCLLFLTVVRHLGFLLILIAVLSSLTYVLCSFSRCSIDR